MIKTVHKLIGAAAILIATSMQAAAQIEDALELSENRYQQCQESGKNVPACAARYYKDVDSLMTLAYKKLRASVKTDGKMALQKDQNDWMMRRDAYFVKLKTDYRVNSKAPVGEDETDTKAALSEDKARYVRERIEVLLSRIPEKAEEEE